MDKGLIPRRYAKALLKFAAEKGKLDEVYTRMQNIERAFDDNKSLQSVIANPFVSPKEKTDLVLTAAGVDKNDNDTIIADFVKLLEQNNRMDCLRQAALAFIDEYRQKKNIYRVDIESAAPLNESDRRRLTDMIDSHLGNGTAEYSFTVNPDLIGGFVVNINNERLDASVSNELKQLRLNLLKQA
ncbi:MAG: ATP synthase F1 subunit delta [Bacteroidales bacterium]|nr:ATP synthase F1 subunit delta [Bacteroidales bacterium]